MNEIESVKQICNFYKGKPIIVSLGNLSKEVFHITKRNDIFYCLGNMGGIISMAFGFTYNNHEKISVIIGDGAFKMNLQSMLLLKYFEKNNINFYIIDNGGFNTTGGQKINDYLDYQDFFSSVGLEKIKECSNNLELRACLNNNNNGINVTIVKVIPFMKNLDRVKLDTIEIKNNFIKEYRNDNKL